jgi:hypothetical protein
MRADDAAWSELYDDRLADRDRRGAARHFGEGRFVTDLLGHIGRWLAAANSFLERIRSGTYRREEIDVDEWNALFLYPARPGSTRGRTRQLACSPNGVRTRVSTLRGWLECPGQGTRIESDLRKRSRQVPVITCHFCVLLGPFLAQTIRRLPSAGRGAVRKPARPPKVASTRETHRCQVCARSQEKPLPPLKQPPAAPSNRGQSSCALT